MNPTLRLLGLRIAAIMFLLTAGGAAAVDNPPPDSVFGQRLIQLQQRLEIPTAPIRQSTGGETNLRAHRGKVVVAVFWATWCHVCQVEMPHLDALQAELGGDGVKVLPISLDRGAQAMDLVQRYYQRSNLKNLPAMQDIGEVNANQLQVYATPTAFILDKQGRLVSVIEGPGQWRTPEAKAYLRSLAAE